MAKMDVTKNGKISRTMHKMSRLYGKALFYHCSLDKCYTLMDY